MYHIALDGDMCTYSRGGLSIHPRLLCVLYLFMRCPPALSFSPEFSSMPCTFIHRSAAPDKGNGNNTPDSMAAVIAENEVPTSVATIKAVASTHSLDNALAVATSPSRCASPRRPQGRICPERNRSGQHDSGSLSVWSFMKGAFAFQGHNC